MIGWSIRYMLEDSCPIVKGQIVARIALQYREGEALDIILLARGGRKCGSEAVVVYLGNVISAFYLRRFRDVRICVVVACNLVPEVPKAPVGIERVRSAFWYPRRRLDVS